MDPLAQVEVVQRAAPDSFSLKDSDGTVLRGACARFLEEAGNHVFLPLCEGRWELSCPHFHHHDIQTCLCQLRGSSGTACAAPHHDHLAGQTGRDSGAVVPGGVHQRSSSGPG